MAVPQKNSGNKNKGQSASRDNHETFVFDYLTELEKYGSVDEIYLGKISKMLGNSRVEVVYQKLAKDGTPLAGVAQALIPGKFQGKNKRYFWIETGTIILVADIGLNKLEVVGVVSPSNLEKIKKHTRVHVSISGNGQEEDTLFEKAEEPELDINEI
jgi:hypothetical protein